MTLSLTCKRCGAEITSNDEDELVGQVQAHVRDDDAGHVPSREHILARLHRQAPPAD
jgi:hypothetical protein